VWVFLGFFYCLKRRDVAINVKKVLNNNVVWARTADKKEVIVMGKGLAFGLKPGDEIAPEAVDKVFALKDQSEVGKFQDLLDQVSPANLELAEQLIDFAKVKLGRKLNNLVHITLTDHINNMYERVQIGAYLQNPMLWDIRRVHPDEFAVAKSIVQQLNTHWQSTLDDHEAANIAMHLVNAQSELDISTTKESTKVVSEILDIIKYHLMIEFDESGLAYYRLSVHLRSFVQRLFEDTTYNDDEDGELLVHVKRKYPRAYHCAQLIQAHVAQTYQYYFKGDELLYLSVHIEKVWRDSREASTDTN